jgi:hypothetical protein
MNQIERGEQKELKYRNQRAALFFHTDVMDVVDYAECMSEKFKLSENFLEAVKKQIDVVLMRRERTIAPATSDVVNSWARELGLPETEGCHDSDVRDAVDKIWAHVSSRLFSSKPCVERENTSSGSSPHATNM